MTDAQTILRQDSTRLSRLYIALELSNKRWRLLFSNGVKRRQVTIAAKNIEQLALQIHRAKVHFQLAEDVSIHSCYEAGRDGFWLHRYLHSQGIDNQVVDSASIEVFRRFRRVKTDRLDVGKLLDMLMRYVNGEQKLWSVVHVPSVEQEDDRRVNREIERLKKERTAHSNRMRSLLVLHGIDMKVGRDFIGLIDRIRCWDGQRLPTHLVAEIRREHSRYELVNEQLRQLAAQKAHQLQADSASMAKVQRLMKLKGIGQISAWNLVHEFFGWRRFKNVKQVGAAAGLVPTCYASGNASVEQGISKAGNRRVRSLMIELGWHWLRYQPQSRLSRWYNNRFGPNGKRLRRVGIVALARKLLVALWQYLEKGLLPQGAVIKP